MNFATLFTGCGGADEGLRQAGLTHEWGLEIKEEYAAIARLNGFNVTTGDVLKTDWATMPKVDWLHASPPCQNASAANPNKGETPLDIALADAVARAIAQLRPTYFSLENVRGYQSFANCRQLLVKCLLENGYHFYERHMDAAAFGVPQRRSRYWLVAVRKFDDKGKRDAWAEWPMPTHEARSDQPSFFKKPHMCWDDAISQPESLSKLSDRMISQLPAEPFGWHLCSGWGKSRAITMIPTGEPAPTITTGMNRPSLRPWAVTRHTDDTIQAYCLTVDDMAALQGFPESYVFPQAKSSERARSFEAIGNSVCPGQIKAIALENIRSMAL